tara:strand:- start:1610 stop:1843 length:234 start_codon:yes stop_codon:yes gene_type:complete
MREYIALREEDIELSKAQAYWTALLSRAKDIPSFDRWMNKAKPGRALEGEEAEQRQAEHDAFAAKVATMMEGAEDDG